LKPGVETPGYIPLPLRGIHLSYLMAEMMIKADFSHGTFLGNRLNVCARK
jgi:hypothetical protein